MCTDCAQDQSMSQKNALKIRPAARVQFQLTTSNHKKEKCYVWRRHYAAGSRTARVLRYQKLLSACHSSGAGSRLAADRCLYG